MPAAPRRLPWALYAGLGLVVAWGLFQCYWNLGGADLGADEPIYLSAGLQYVHGDFSNNLEHPPLAKFILGWTQVLTHHGVYAGRFVTTTFVFAIGWLLFFWLRREIGWKWAFLAAALWWILPRSAGDSGARVDRFALLDPWMTCFAIVSVVLAWWWFRRPRWWLAGLAGVFMACSATSKISTTVLVVSFVYIVVRRRELRSGLVGILVYAVGFAATFLAVYAPINIWTGIGYMIRFQAAQKDEGHGIIMNGKLVDHPPWWANLWYTEQDLGIFLLIALCVAAVFAFVPKPSELTIYITVVAAIMIAFYCFVVGNALPQYSYAWIWALIVVAVIGLRRLWHVTSPFVQRRRRSARVRPWVVARLVIVGVLIVAVINGVTTSAFIVGEHQMGFALAAATLKEHGVTSPKVLAVGYPAWQWEHYLFSDSTAPVTDANGVTTLHGAPYGAIAISSTVDPVEPSVAAFVKEYRPELDLVHLGNDVNLYLPKSGSIGIRGQTLFLQN